MGLIGLVIMFAPAIGPAISGLILANLTWHWIFWISLPFLAIALIFGILFLENVSKITKPKIDILSIVLSTLGFGGIVFGFSSAGEGSGGWGSPVVVGTLLLGAVSLLLFGFRQMKMKQPMINLRAFKFPMFTIGLILVFICMMMILSSMLILPLYLQQGMALTALGAGLVLLPGSLLNGFLSPVMGRLFDKFGPKWLVIIGLSVATIALFSFTRIHSTTPVGLIIGLHTALMVGISMIMMPAQTNGLNQLPREYYPDGTAIMNTLQQVAGAIGTALAVSILSAGRANFLSGVDNPKDPANVLSAFTVGVQHAFIFAVVIAVIGLICALFIKRVNVKHGM